MQRINLGRHSPADRRHSAPRHVRVALLVETALVYGRRILRGIASYVQSHQPWSIVLAEPEDQLSPPAWLERWRGDGIICRFTNARLARILAKAKVPLIDLNDYGDLGLPRICSDHRAIGRLGAEHLLECGFLSFGFCGLRGVEWAAMRRDGFVAAVQQAGLPASVCESPSRRRQPPPSEQDQRKLVSWLKSLPKPAGVMASNDWRGQRVLNACRCAGISVPEEVAVIGVDDDDLVCNLCDPPLSSVVPNTTRIGYEAAARLDELMSGRRLPQREWLIEPLGVAARQSSDVLAIDDPDVAAAVRYIREAACSGIDVPQVLERVAISRSHLERGFHKFLGRTPQQEIRLVQTERVKQLLTDTDLPLAQISALAGYKHPEYMSYVFKRETTHTPGEYRRQARQAR
jgi:LacI family transcriptional regulator